MKRYEFSMPCAVKAPNEETAKEYEQIATEIFHEFMPKMNKEYKKRRKEWDATHGIDADGNKSMTRYEELTMLYGDWLAWCIENGSEDENDIIEQLNEAQEENYVDMDTYAEEHKDEFKRPDSWIEGRIRYSNGGLHGEILDDDVDEEGNADATKMPEGDDTDEVNSFSELQKKIEPEHESIIKLSDDVAVSRYLLRGKSCDYEPVYHKIVDGKLACTTKKVIHDFVSIPEETLIPMRVSYKGKRVKICRCKECFK